MNWNISNCSKNYLNKTIQYCYRKNAAPLTRRKNRKDKLICNSSHSSSKSLDLELFQRIPGWRRNFVVWSKQTNKVENHETEVCLFWFYCVSPLLIIYSSCLVVPLEGQFSIARWHGCLKVYPSPVLDCKTNWFWQRISVLVIYLDLLKCMV